MTTNLFSIFLNKEKSTDILKEYKVCSNDMNKKLKLLSTHV